MNIVGAHRNFSREGQGLGDMASADRFAWLTTVTDRPTDRPRSSVCNNRLHLLCGLATLIKAAIVKRFSHFVLYFVATASVTAASLFTNAFKTAHAVARITGFQFHRLPRHFLDDFFVTDCLVTQCISRL